MENHTGAALAERSGIPFQRGQDVPAAERFGKKHNARIMPADVANGAHTWTGTTVWTISYYASRKRSKKAGGEVAY
ncbi:MAG TPA: hypothetical protein VKR32_03720 [Puia sp.]|nr:hypothetical protein [Puia sp.]